MIEIYLYGKLKKGIQENTVPKSGVLHLQPVHGDTIASVLKRADIATSNIYSLFLNAKLLAARSNMARWLRYQQAGPDPLSWDLDIPVQSGDRIGVFGRDMAALVV